MKEKRWIDERTDRAHCQHAIRRDQTREHPPVVRGERSSAPPSCHKAEKYCQSRKDATCHGDADDLVASWIDTLHDNDHHRLAACAGNDSLPAGTLWVKSKRSVGAQPLKLLGQERRQESAVKERMQVYCMRKVLGVCPKEVAGYRADGFLQTIALSSPAAIPNLAN